MAKPGTKAKRPYKMGARATAKATTREKILAASAAAGDELPADEITLAWIAERAGVSVQTVIRHFGSREGLFVATVEHAGAEMVRGREVQPDWPAARIVATLADHYEEFGERVLRGLAQEHRVPRLGVLMEIGRNFHVEWCKQAFAPALEGLRGATRERRIAQLTAVTDVYIWKVLRQDRGLSQAQTRLAMLELVESVLEGRA